MGDHRSHTLAGEGRLRQLVSESSEILVVSHIMDDPEKQTQIYTVLYLLTMAHCPGRKNFESLFKIL